MNANRRVVARLFATITITLAVVAFYLLSYEQTQAEKVIYTGRENHLISLEKAKKLAHNFKLTAKSNDLTAGYFGRGIFDRILEQDGCVGIRIYNAVSEQGTPTYIIIGVDGDGDDMLSGPVGDEVKPCPPWCGSVNLSSEPEIAMKK